MPIVATVGHGRYPKAVAPFFVPAGQVFQTLDDSVVESVTTTDNQSAIATLLGTVAESVTTTDTPSVIATFIATAAESVTATDTPSVTAVFTPTVAESVTTTDTSSAVAIFSSSVAESVTSVDVFTASSGVSDSITESISIVDVFSATVEATATYASKYYLSRKEPKVVVVSSSTIEEVTHDKNSNELTVKFKSGRVYNYTNMDEKKVKALIRAKSSGKYLHNNIKGKYFTNRMK